MDPNSELVTQAIAEAARNNQTILTFCFTAIASLAGFIGFMIKKGLDIFRENITVMTEVKTGIKELSENVKTNTNLVSEHLIKGN